jgi:hypothetical protein
MGNIFDTWMPDSSVGTDCNVAVQAVFSDQLPKGVVSNLGDFQSVWLYIKRTVTKVIY